VAGWRDANFFSVVLIHRAGKVFSSSADSIFVSRFCQQISSADSYQQQICLLSADSVSRFLSSAVFLFVSRFCQQISLVSNQQISPIRRFLNIIDFWGVSTTA
jgi:hypothetical protein